MTRKLLFGFALLVCAALVGVVVNDNPMTYADDSEKASPNTTNETPPATTNEAKPAENAPKAQPEPMPSALPENELPLYPEQRAIWTCCYLNGNDSVHISVIVDGHKKVYKVRGGKAEDLVSFRVRTDDWKHASTQFFGRSRFYEDEYSFAVILIPDRDSLDRWNKYYANQVAEARDLAMRAEKAQKGPPERAYPTNVLPPK